MLISKHNLGVFPRTLWIEHFVWLSLKPSNTHPSFLNDRNIQELRISRKIHDSPFTALLLISRKLPVGNFQLGSPRRCPTPELGKKKPCKSVCALTETLFTCWPLHVANTPLNCKLNISMISTYFRLHEHIATASSSSSSTTTTTSATASTSSSQQQQQRHQLQAAAVAAAAEGVAAPPPEPPPATPSTRPAGPSTRPGPDQHQTCTTSTSTRSTRTTTSQHKHRHNWPPAQASASSDSKSKDMEVLKGGCLAKRKRKYRLVYRFCIVLGIVWEGAISWQDWAS